VVSGVPLLRPEEQVFTAMLEGFANQQLARNLARTTVEGRENTVKAFASYVNAFPWQWTAAMVDEWLGDLRSLRDLKRSTIRGYSQAISSFCGYVTDCGQEARAVRELRSMINDHREGFIEQVSPSSRPGTHLCLRQA
jgi:hypothetical protein